MTNDHNPSRRAVVTAGVWAAPAVALAVATPAAAASTTPVGTIVGTNWTVESRPLADFPFHINVYYSLDDGSALPDTIRMRYIFNGESWDSSNEAIWAGGHHREASGFWPSNIPLEEGTTISVTGSGYDRISEDIYVLQPATVSLTFA